MGHAAAQNAEASRLVAPGIFGQYTHCRLCGCGIGDEIDDDPAKGLCAHCLERPEARRLGVAVAAPAARTPGAAGTTPRPPARDFTDAERSLIAHVSSFMPRKQLLDLLNERLVFDLGQG